MSKLVFDEEGKIYYGHHLEEVSTDDLQGEITEAQAQIATINKVISLAGAVSAPAQTPVVAEPAPVAAVEQAPSVTEAPVDPTTAAAVETAPAAEPEIPAEVAADPTLAVDSTVAAEVPPVVLQ